MESEEVSLMKISALILNWNQAELALAAAASVATQVTEVVLVDNGSREDDVSLLRRGVREHGYRLIVNEVNLGYAGGNNVGIVDAIERGAERLLVMNSDALAHAGSVQLLHDALDSDERIAVAMPAVVDARTGLVIHTSCRVNARTGAGQWDDYQRPIGDISREVRSTEYVSGEAFLARSAAFTDAGAFDERFFCYFEDGEWSMRLRGKDWMLVAVPAATFSHIVGASGVGLVGSYYRARNQVLFLRLGLRRGILASATTTAISLLRPLAIALLRDRNGRAAWAIARGWMAGVSLSARA
jgi:GT2 family glycosyltransferase